MDSEAGRSLRGSAVASGGIVFISYPLLNEPKCIWVWQRPQSEVEQRAEPDEARATLWVARLAGIIGNALRRLARALDNEAIATLQRTGPCRIARLGNKPLGRRTPY